MSEIPAPIGTGTRFERLSAKDFRVLIIWILLGALGVFVAWRYFFQAFPEASINFQVSRDEALSRAKTFLTQRGASLDGYESTIVFSVDDNTKTYLERTVGLATANRRRVASGARSSSPICGASQARARAAGCRARR